MLKTFTLQKSTQTSNEFYHIFPYKYLYFDKYLNNLTKQNKPTNLTINLFDGKVKVSIYIADRQILITGNRDLSFEVMRHLNQISAIKDFVIEVER